MPQKRQLLSRAAEGSGDEPRHRLHPHQAWRQQGGRASVAGPAIEADAIHGNKSQNARQRALELFRSGKARVLVATDIAARGIDIDDISHVVNFELPNEPESYVHRIGRTARAGGAGHRPLVLRCFRARLSARHRAGDPHEDRCGGA